MKRSDNSDNTDNGGNGLPTMGVEEEFFVIDRDGRLRGAGPWIVHGADVETSEGDLQHELNLCQVESATGICHSPQQILSQLTEYRRRFAETAATRNLRLLPSGVPLTVQDKLPDITPKKRFLLMAQWFGATATSFVTCGCHVHIAIPDQETAIKVSDHLRSWLPILLAITANSPIWRGKDTSYASWRYQQWTMWPTSGPPPHFGSLDNYENMLDQILRSEASLDRGMIYWYIRPSEKHDTIEFRISDVPATAEESALLAVLIRGLVVMAIDEIDSGKKASGLSNEVLRANLWRAARMGLMGSCPHPITGELTPAQTLLNDLLTYVRPALRYGTDDFEFAQAGLAKLRERGGGAQRQLAALARQSQQDVGSVGNVERVVDMLALS